MMKYKGYIGNVEYDDKNHVFSGKIINIKTVVTFVGTSVDELEAEFRNSVDDYLHWCAADGIEPERPFSGKLNVRFTPELHSRAAAAASITHTSLNSFIVRAVEDKLQALML